MIITLNSSVIYTEEDDQSVREELREENEMNKIKQDLKDSDVFIELNVFNDIKLLNWAWVYLSSQGNWTQFDCI